MKTKFTATIILCILLIAALSLTACSSKKDSGEKDNSKTDSAASAAADAEENDPENTPEGVVQAYWDARAAMDHNKRLSVTFSANFSKDKTMEDFQAEALEEIEELKAEGKYEAYLDSVNTKRGTVTGVEEMDENKKEELFAKLEDTCYGLDKITDVKIVTVLATREGYDNNEPQYPVVKCDGRWYIVTNYSYH